MVWEWQFGNHSVSNTSGPSAFATGDLQAPHNFQREFSPEGTYNYECSLFNHADTQPGAVTLETATVISPGPFQQVRVFPKSFKDNLRVEISDLEEVESVQLFSAANGNLIHQQTAVSLQNESPVADLPKGLYLFILTGKSKGITKSLLKL